MTPEELFVAKLTYRQITVEELLSERYDACDADTDAFLMFRSPTDRFYHCRDDIYVTDVDLVVPKEVEFTFRYKSNDVMPADGRYNDISLRTDYDGPDYEDD